MYWPLPEEILKWIPAPQLNHSRTSFAAGMTKKVFSLVLVPLHSVLPHHLFDSPQQGVLRLPAQKPLRLPVVEQEVGRDIPDIGVEVKPGAQQHTGNVEEQGRRVQKKRRNGKDPQRYAECACYGMKEVRPGVVGSVCQVDYLTGGGWLDARKIDGARQVLDVDEGRNGTAPADPGETEGTEPFD